MKMNFKDILTNKEVITNNDILTINYITATGKGCFKLLMPAKFPTTAATMKIIIDMLLKAEVPEAEARPLYDYLTKCVEALKDFRELAKKVDEPGDVAQVTNEIKRYNANIEALCKYFKFEAAEDPEAVKLQKVEVVKQGTKNGKKFVENRTGKKFVKYGHTFHVYKEPKGDCYIIIPCCGIAALAYNGGIAEAPEHITKDLITKLDKLNFKELNKAFVEVLEGAENVVINEDINIIYNDETTAPAEEAPRPEAVENETTAPATAEETENKPRPHAEVAPDPDINNAINLCDTNYCYTIIAEPHGCYTVIGQNTAIFKYISIRIDSTGAIQLYSNGKNNYTENKYFHNDNTVLLYDLYEKLFALDLLPHYEPTETTRENIKGIYNRHTTPRPQPPYYIAVIPEAMNHTTTGDSTPASLKRANIPPRPNKRHTTPYNRRQQPNKGILYHYNAIQGHYSPVGLYNGINRHIATLQGYTRTYHAQTAPPGLYATGDRKAGIIRAQTMPNLLYHDTC